MWLFAADVVDSDAIKTWATIGLVIATIGTLLGGLRTLVDGARNLFGSKDKQSAESLLEKDTLTKSDKKIIGDELKSRRTMVWWLIGTIAGLVIAGAFIYRNVMVSRKALPNQIPVKAVKAIDPEDAWIKTHRAFTPLVSSLMPVITDQPAPNAAGSKNSQVISIQTGEFGESTSKHPTEATTRVLRYPVADYKFQPPYVFLLKKTASGEAFQGLAVSEEKDGWRFAIPEADAKDSLLIIGQLVHARDATIPTELSTMFQIVEVAK